MAENKLLIARYPLSLLMRAALLFFLDQFFSDSTHGGGTTSFRTG
jgi:hypothetical protein